MAEAGGTGLSRPGVLWLLLSTLLALAAVGAFAAERSLIDWQPRRWSEAWRWWSAALVHWTPMHLGANLLATGLVAVYGWAARVPRSLSWAWLASWPLTHVALLAKPALLHYGGLSGVLHGGVAAVSLWLLLCGQGAQRTVGGLMLAGQSIKLLVEEPWGAAIHPPSELDVAVAPLAHATGSIAGVLCTLLALYLTRQPARPDVD